MVVGSWGLPEADIAPHTGGMNSRTWLVRHGERTWMAKAVPANRQRRFVSGLAVASIVEDAGIPAGRPEPTMDGRDWVAVEDHAMALLLFVEGEPLIGDDPDEQHLIGATLAQAHRALLDRDVPGAEVFHWLDPDAPHLDVAPWVRPAVRDAIGAYDALPPASLSWGLLHTDPAPEAFLLDRRTGTCGMIDWDTGLTGPLMYDVASAVMYVGGSEWATALLDAYLTDAVIPASEVDRALGTMLRMRWAVQADYFAMRVATNDLTGVSGPEENAAGLEDARRALAPEPPGLA